MLHTLDEMRGLLCPVNRNKEENLDCRYDGSTYMKETNLVFILNVVITSARYVKLASAEGRIHDSVLYACCCELYFRL
jgi:putative lipase involved disintegration of autophagic bodies